VKKVKIVHNCLEQAVTSLMYHCKFINKFVFLSASLLLGRKCVQFQCFFTDITVLRWRQARNNHLRLNRIKSSVKSNPG